MAVVYADEEHLAGEGGLLESGVVPVDVMRLLEGERKLGRVERERRVRVEVLLVTGIAECEMCGRGA